VGEKILVVDLLHIGDLLFATPALRALRAAFPAAHIALLADAKIDELVRYNRHIDELVSVDKKGYHDKLRNYLGLIRQIRRRQFDLAINLHPNERASAIAAFSGAKCIVGLSAKGFALFFDRVTEGRRDIHQADAYLEVLKLIGIESADKGGPEIWVDEGSRRRAQKLWREKFPGEGPVVGLNPGASWPTKRWPPAAFAALADRLAAEGIGAALFGGPMDADIAAEILARMENGRRPAVAVFTGRTTLLEYAALVKNCRALVSGDSGPMHIAAAQKVPVVAIFGPSDPVRYGPYGHPEAVLRAAHSCLGCGRHECERHTCMNDITPEMVMAKVKDALGLT